MIRVRVFLPEGGLFRGEFENGSGMAGVSGKAVKSGCDILSSLLTNRVRLIMLEEILEAKGDEERGRTHDREYNKDFGESEAGCGLARLSSQENFHGLRIYVAGGI